MNTLDRIEAALEAKREAYTAWDAKLGGPYSALDQALDDAAMHLDDLLTDDTVAALIAVARRMEQVHLSDICALIEDWYCESHSCDACGTVTDPCVLAPLRAATIALASLLEEVPDDRA